MSNVEDNLVLGGARGVMVIVVETARLAAFHIVLVLYEMVLVLYEMQLVSSRIWTRVAVSISYDGNHYTTGTS